MTFVVMVHGPDSIWALADRGLSSPGQPLRENACKLMVLTTSDGFALLGYGGLGSTDFYNEPADWMSRVLQGTDMPLENSLGTLAGAMVREFPPHLLKALGNGERPPAHAVVATAFVGEEARAYSIDVAFSQDRMEIGVRYLRRVLNTPQLDPPRISCGGSGADHLVKDESWERDRRDLYSLVRDYDQKKISARVVADRLAALNLRAHNAADKTVSQRCIVMWRDRRHSVRQGGGGRQFYNGTTPEPADRSIPMMSRGTDTAAMMGIVQRNFMNGTVEEIRSGRGLASNLAKATEELGGLPNKPDEKLR